MDRSVVCAIFLDPPQTELGIHFVSIGEVCSTEVRLAVVAVKGSASDDGRGDDAGYGGRLHGHRHPGAQPGQRLRILTVGGRRLMIDETTLNMDFLYTM